MAPSVLELGPRLLGSARAPNPGPTLIIVGSMHGNEPAGVTAAKAVLESLENNPTLERGRFVALVGNRRAIAHDQSRYIHQDLNRMFSHAQVHQARTLEPEHRSPEQQELVELVEMIESEAMIASGPLFLIDIHTVSSKAPPFAAVEDSLRGRRFAQHFGLPLLLGFEEELDGLLSDYFTGAFDGVGLVVEAGQHRDQEATEIAQEIIWRAIEYTGLMRSSPIDTTRLEQSAGSFSGRVFDVRFRHVIKDESFEIDHELHALDPVSAGRVVGTQSGDELIVPESGLLFMPNRQEVKRVGDDGYFIVHPVGNMWLSVSAFLRKRRLIHAALPYFLPGVRRRTGHPGQLLVSPRIAAIMKRELFHLLGYRLLRHEGEVHLPVYKRLGLGALAFIRGLRMILSGIIRGGERALLSEEQPDDWIVAIRHLDQIDQTRGRSQSS